MQRLIRNVSVVVGIAVCLTTVLAAPAAARRRHHRRNHHVACGPDTVFQNGVCVFVDPPVGDPNVVIQPNPIQMTITGHVVGAITFHGLLPFDVLTMNTVSIPDPCGGDCGPPPLGPAGIPCGLNAVLTVTPNPIVADAAGNATAQLFDTTLPPGPGGWCRASIRWSSSRSSRQRDPRRRAPSPASSRSSSDRGSCVGSPKV